MAMNQPAFGIPDLQGVIPAEVLTNGALELPKGKYSLHQTGGPHRMTAGEESSRWVDRDFSTQAGRTGFNEFTAIAVFTQTQILIGLNF